MSKILILNGPNLGHLGKRDIAMYGTANMDTVAEHVAHLEDAPPLEIYQSNHEGALIDCLEKARERFLQKQLMGVVLNAGAFTHTSLALADCLSWIKVPFVEVHISNILARSNVVSSATEIHDGGIVNPSDVLRGQSLFAAYSLGVIAGFGIESYVLAVEALIRYTKVSNQTI